MPIPESVKVTFKGEMQEYMDFRDVVHATQNQMLKKHNLVIVPVIKCNSTCITTE